MFHCTKLTITHNEELFPKICYGLDVLLKSYVMISTIDQPPKIFKCSLYKDHSFRDAVSERIHTDRQ